MLNSRYLLYNKKLIAPLIINKSVKGGVKINLYKRWILIFVLLLLVSGCAEKPSSNPCVDGPIIRAEMEADFSNWYNSWNYDYELVLAARLIPGGFGGIYRSESNYNNIVMVLVDIGKSSQAVSTLNEALNCKALFSGEIDFDEIEIAKGQFNFTQLFQWKEKAGIAFSDDAAQSLDADEFRNRVVIGVVEEGAIDRVRQLVINAGVPPGALVVELESLMMEHM